MAEAILATPHRSTWLVCLGPLTNAALALSTHDKLADHLGGLCFMGGAITHHGNMNSSVEFNLFQDPEAAKMVIEKFGATSLKDRLVMIPLDVTMTALSTPKFREHVKRNTGPVCVRGWPANSDLPRIMHEILGAAANRAKNFPVPLRHVAPAEQGLCTALHDPCAVLYCRNPSLFEVKNWHVQVFFL